MAAIDSAFGRLDTVSIVREGQEVVFAAVNNATGWRVDSAMTKEPGTVSWIEGFAPGEVLVDVGANIGLYALCAARFRGVRAYAFEPESQNFALLNWNIFRNRLDQKVTAYCVALSDDSRFDLLYLSEFSAGGSCHSFGASVNPFGQPMSAAFRQGCFATSLDRLVAEGVVGVPDHIKIDVDGNEPQVIRGARRTLADARVKSVLVELNASVDAHWEVIDHMLELGFAYSQAEAERAIRKEGPFEGVGNYVFRR